MTNVATLSGSAIPVEEMVRGIAKDAQAASHALSRVESETRSDALRQGAAAIRERMPDILTTNTKDMAFGHEKGLSDAMLDRLLLTEERLSLIHISEPTRPY